MRTIIVIYNSQAGQKDQLATIKAAFAQRKVHPQYLSITSKDTTAILDRAIQKNNVSVVAAGGDGTVNYVAARLYNTKCSMGVIAMGTLNHFAKTAGVPLDISKAIDIILANKYKKIDVGIVNRSVFVNNSSIGFYPRSLVARKTFSNVVGKWPAAVAGFFYSLSHLRRYRVSIVIDGKKQTLRTPFVFVGNNQYQHTPLDIGARPSLVAGQLSVYVVKLDSLLRIIPILIHTFFAKRYRTKDFAVYQTEKCTIYTHHRRKIRVACDGEVFSVSTPLHFRSEKKSLRVIV